MGCLVGIIGGAVGQVGQLIDVIRERRGSRWLCSIEFARACIDKACGVELVVSSGDRIADGVVVGGDQGAGQGYLMPAVLARARAVPWCQLQHV